MADHTPLPWRVEDMTGVSLDACRFENGAFQIVSDDCDFHAVADCSANHTCRGAWECEANANLIVLAVNSHDDLRHALREMVQAAEGVGLDAKTRRRAALSVAVDLLNRLDTGKTDATDVR